MPLPAGPDWASLAFCDVSAIRRWWRQPVRGGWIANGRVPRWAILVLALWVGGIEAIVLGLLPILGVRWFYDHWRFGGSLPVVAALVVGALWLDRRWPYGDDAG